MPDQKSQEILHITKMIDVNRLDMRSDQSGPMNQTRQPPIWIVYPQRHQVLNSLLIWQKVGLARSNHRVQELLPKLLYLFVECRSNRNHLASQAH